MRDGRNSERAADLATRLREAGAALIAVVEAIDDEAWGSVPHSGTWSIGKEAQHVAEAAVYHHWIVRLTIGGLVSSRRPPIERATLTPDLSSIETVDRLRLQTAEGVSLLADLTDDQLDLPTRPPRARGERLAKTIDRVLIAHYATHMEAIEAKVRQPRGEAGPGDGGSVSRSSG